MVYALPFSPEISQKNPSTTVPSECIGYDFPKPYWEKNIDFYVITINDYSDRNIYSNSKLLYLI